MITGIIGAPFAWCAIPGGSVELADASQEGGTKGGQYTVADFWIAKYPVTNAQYQAFIDASDGFCNARGSFHPRPGSGTAITHAPNRRPSWGKTCRARG